MRHHFHPRPETQELKKKEKKDFLKHNIFTKGTLLFVAKCVCILSIKVNMSILLKTLSNCFVKRYKQYIQNYIFKETFYCITYLKKLFIILHI